MNESEIADYVANMSDEELKKIFTEMVEERVKMQFAAQVEEQMAREDSVWNYYKKLLALRKDPEDADALQKLPAPRHMYSCQAHCELARRIMLLLERKEIKKLQKEIPALEELRTARFAELRSHRIRRDRPRRMGLRALR